MAGKELKKINEKAGGIDIGATSFFLSMDGENIRVYDTFTGTMAKIVNDLQAEGITTVAMEATGVLWVPLHDMIESAGIEVYLVNSYHSRNVPAQKTDSKDCRWLQTLHSYGLLKKSFVPSAEIRELRTYVRLREDHIEMAAQEIQHIQKAFELMNIKLHNVISDIKGRSGMLIIEAILAGQTNAEELVKFCDNRIEKGKHARIIESLVGNYKKEYLFLLKQAYQGYQFYQNQIKACDHEIGILLDKITTNLPKPPKTKASPARHNQPEISDLHERLMQLTGGRDATVLPGLCDKTIMKLIAELGTDLSRWATEKHFTSWLGLCPWKKQSGKMNKHKRHPAKTNAGQIFRESAMSIANCKHLALKGFYYRIKSKRGYKIAIKATAKKIAELFYRFMTKGLEYVEYGLKEYERMYQERITKSISKKAYNLGYALVKIP
jgi:transposase